MKQELLFNFERKDIMAHCKNLPSIEEQLNYLQLVLKKYKTNPPDLDTNYGLKPKLETLLKTEIEFKKEIIKNKIEQKITEERLSSKEKWAGTKSEFADKVKEEYENNSPKYKSLSDASNKMFEKYEFEDKKWTKAKCYDMVRK